MDKIQLIKEAIEKADRFESKLSQEAIEVPFLGSLKIRALLNNLGEIGTHFLEIGSHKGGSFCSTIYGNDNLKGITAIDSWASDYLNEDKAYKEFHNNVPICRPKNAVLNVIMADCFKLDLNLILDGMVSKDTIDLYSYDAGHTYEDQKQALLYYKDILADEFIYCCDDWQYGQVKEGTLAGIKEGGYQVLFEQELLNPEPYSEDQHLNDHWWRGYYVALLKKKA